MKIFENILLQINSLTCSTQSCLYTSTLLINQIYIKVYQKTAQSSHNCSSYNYIILEWTTL